MIAGVDRGDVCGVRGTLGDDAEAGRDDGETSRTIDRHSSARAVERAGRLVDIAGMILDRAVMALARASAATARASRSIAPISSARRDADARTATATSTSGEPSRARARGVITVSVERGDAERAYKRLRRIMMSEGAYEDLRASTEGHRKPSQLRVLARKERERRTMRQKLNSKLGWIVRQKERGF